MWKVSYIVLTVGACVCSKNRKVVDRSNSMVDILGTKKWLGITIQIYHAPGMGTGYLCM